MPDDKTPVEAIADAEAQADALLSFAPEEIVGENAYYIVKQRDGNYKGWTLKNGKHIVIRDIGPETVLQRLLTHP